MTTEEKKLIMDLAIKSITKEEFLKGYPVDLQHNNNYILESLKKAYKDKNAEDVEYALLLIGYFDFGEKYADILCKIISEKWHRQHEIIAGLLQSLKVPQSIDCLYQTATANFKYLEFDESYALSVKCIWALGDINTEYAREKLRLLAQSDNPIIKENAVNQLNRNH